MAELKPCAHCLSPEEGSRIIEQGHTWNGLRRVEYYARCLDCGIMTLTYNSREEAVSVWNARAAEPLKEVISAEQEAEAIGLVGLYQMVKQIKAELLFMGEIINDIPRMR